MKITRFIIFLFVLIPWASCDKEEEHPIPDVSGFTFSLSIYSNYELQNINGYVYVNDYGFNGVLVYRYSHDEFTAFDMACPYHPREFDCRVEVSEPQIAIDECCESRFLLTDGMVVDGPSQYPLKRYRATFNQATNTVSVSNY